MLLFQAPPPTLSLSAGGSSKVFTLTWAVRLDKVTAGQFSSALYLLLLLGKSFRARQLSTATIYYHKEDRGEEKQRDTRREEVFVWECVRLSEVDSVCARSSVLIAKAKLA